MSQCRIRHQNFNCYLLYINFVVIHSLLYFQIVNMRQIKQILEQFKTIVK